MGISRLSIIVALSALPGVASAASISPTQQLGPLLIASTSIKETLTDPDTTITDNSQTKTSGSANSFSLYQGVSEKPDPATSLASSSASFGSLHAFAASGIGQYGFAYNDVTATATFFDPITILPLRGLTSRTAKVNFSFNVLALVSGGTYSGLLTYLDSKVEVTWDVGLYSGTDRIGGVSGTTDYTDFGNYADGRSYIQSGSATGLQSFSMLAAGVTGRPLSLVATLSCEAFNGGVCNATHSLEWGGMSLTDDDGVDLGPLTAFSESGEDYAQPNAAFLSGVPEPSSWAMMIVGFGLIGGAIRRREGGRQTTRAYRHA